MSPGHMFLLSPTITCELSPDDSRRVSVHSRRDDATVMPMSQWDVAVSVRPQSVVEDGAKECCEERKCAANGTDGRRREETHKMYDIISKSFHILNRFSRRSHKATSGFDASQAMEVLIVWLVCCISAAGLMLFFKQLD